jgi:ABC-type cobalamin/Fe3+-siderophores transport system ATPase subunit
MMIGTIYNYYAGGNTARGFYNLFESNLNSLNRIYILKGGPGTGKSTLMKNIGQYWVHKGFDIELIHCASDLQSIDGVIIPQLKAGIVDGTAPHVIEPKAPGAIEEYVNLGEAWDSKKLVQHKNEILEIKEKIGDLYKLAYETFAKALKIHDDWEKIYIENMDFEKANELTRTLIEKFFKNHAAEKSSIVKHRFLGAATPKGPVDFIENLTENVKSRYFIKGRPGSGKSTMLKKIAHAAIEKGFDVEIYHCGFDPKSLDMVIVRELDFAIFDSTPPHEYFPNRKHDEIIDMYKECITPGTDEKYKEKLEEISTKYADTMKKGTAYLAQAKTFHNQLENIYVQAMDFSKVTKLEENILSQLEEMKSY